MTLKQIDTRLALFPDYLRYRTEHWRELPYGVIHTLKTMGMLFINNTPILTFDQWLYLHNHQDLVLYSPLNN